MSQTEAVRAIWPEGRDPDGVLGSPAVKAGHWLFVGGELGGDFKRGLFPQAIAANPLMQDPMAVQAHAIYEQLRETISAGGCDIAKDVVRIWQWFTSDFPTREERQEGITWPRVFIGPYLGVRDLHIMKPKPASTAVVAHRLLATGARVQTDMICMDGGGVSEAFQTPPGVPSPGSHYAPAHRRGDWVFLAGEIPVDWVGDFYGDKFPGHASGLSKEARVNPYFWFGSVIEAQTDHVLDKLSKTAEFAGSSLARAVKADVYLADAADFPGFDRAWKRWFPDSPPARCIIPNIGFGGYGSRIEIALTLLANDSPLRMETVRTSAAREPVGHEPQAVKVGPTLFLSGQMACDARGVLLPGMQRDPGAPFSGQPGRAQIEAIAANVAAICEAAGGGLHSVVRSCWFLNDGSVFAEANAAWMDMFTGVKPATTAVLVDGSLATPGANLLLDLTAYCP
jgi:enamine deaminase RidA (YjgF/YER057c/UK114 family)